MARTGLGYKTTLLAYTLTKSPGHFYLRACGRHLDRSVGLVVTRFDSMQQALLFGVQDLQSFYAAGSTVFHRVTSAAPRARDLRTHMHMLHVRSRRSTWRSPSLETLALSGTT